MMNFKNLISVIKKFMYLLFVVFVIIIFMCFFGSTKENREQQEPDGNELDESVIEEMPKEKTFSSSLPETDEETKAERIEFRLPDGNVLSVDESRITDFYGWGHLENRWELEEIDMILDSIKGYWEIDKYVGFVPANIYDGTLFDYPSDDDPYYAELYDQYDEKVKLAEENIPDIFFSVKEGKFEGDPSNYIYTKGRFYSPVNIILSLERLGDCYPILSERTAVSGDFVAEYPVLYIQFFLNKISEGSRGSEYQSASIIITSDSDSEILLLTDGAFYSIKRMEETLEGTR